MIVFLGCSLTWGQGLHIESLLDSNKVGNNYINNQEPPQHPSENLSYEEDTIRKKYHYPNLVAKHFNRPYCTKYGNGGSNTDILTILKSINSQMMAEGIEAVVIQLTHVYRDNVFQSQFTKEKNYNDFLEYYVKSIVYKIEEYCKNLSFDKDGNNKNVPFIIMSWHKDVADILQSILSNQFLTFGEYNNLEDLMNSNKNYRISTKHFNISDNHPTIECHEAISTYLIKKIKELNISFDYFNFLER